MKRSFRAANPLLRKFHKSFSPRSSPDHNSPLPLSAAAHPSYAASATEKKPDGKKIIFLDVDGVLHSIRVTRQEQLFNPQKMALLRKMIANTDAQVGRMISLHGSVQVRSALVSVSWDCTSCCSARGVLAVSRCYSRIGL